METPLASHTPSKTLLEQVETAVRILRDGGVIAFPTDTLYGLAASPFNDRAVERLFKIKGRDESVPLPLLLADTAEITKYAVDVPEVFWSLAERFWPGPLTLVVRKLPMVPDTVVGGLETVGVRVPDHWVPREIVRQLGAPITGTSANRAGMPGPTTADAVVAQLDGEIDFVIDAGQCPGGAASTVLDISGPFPLILREGAVSRQEIEVVGGVTVAVG